MRVEAVSDCAPALFLANARRPGIPPFRSVRKNICKGGAVVVSTTPRALLCRNLWRHASDQQFGQLHAWQFTRLSPFLIGTNPSVLAVSEVDERPPWLNAPANSLVLRSTHLDLANLPGKACAPCDHVLAQETSPQAANLMPQLSARRLSCRVLANLRSSVRILGNPCEAPLGHGSCRTNRSS